MVVLQINHENRLCSLMLGPAGYSGPLAGWIYRLYEYARISSSQSGAGADWDLAQAARAGVGVTNIRHICDDFLGRFHIAQKNTGGAFPHPLGPQ